MNNKKYYVRLDGQNRAIAGSGVWRNKMPVTGNWMFVEGDVCCRAVVSLSDEPTAPGMINITVSILCDGSQVALFTLTGSSSSSLATLATELNLLLGFLGTFSVVGDEIQLNMFLEIAQAYCADTTLLTMAVSGTTTSTSTTTTSTTTTTIA